MNRYFILLLFCLPLAALCQDSTRLRGTVRAATDLQPLPGASLHYRHAPGSTAAGIDGSFSLPFSGMTDTLLVSYIGYQTAAVYIGRIPGNPLVINLKPAPGSLKEVLVSTGYQQLPKERATGSFVQIDNELLNRRVSPDILSRLEDVTSGLVFNSESGLNNSLSIRGQSTIASDPQPLIIVDNFPYDGDIANINPNDVQSITVLKDAAAASIWGARAGNGVIVISTKKGAYNQALQVSFNANVTSGARPNLFYQPQMSSADFISVEKLLFSQGFYSDSQASADHEALTPVVALLYARQNGTISAAEADAQITQLARQDVRNDFSKYFYRQSLNQQYALNLSGGSPGQRYYVSAGYDHNLSSLVGNGYDRLTLTASNTYTLLHQRLEVTTGFNLTQSRTQANNPGAGGITYSVNSNTLYPYARLADAQGQPLAIVKDYQDDFLQTAAQQGLTDWRYRPLAELKLADNSSSITDYRLNTNLAYKVLPGLNASLYYQYERSQTNGRDYQSPETYYTRNLVNQFTQAGEDGSLSYILPPGGILDQASSTLYSHNLRAQLDYHRQWAGQNELTALGGYELKDLHTSGYSFRNYGYDDAHASSQPVDYVNAYPLYQDPDNTGQIPNLDSRSDLSDRYLSWFANAAYTYRRKYTLSASARWDRSNLFGVHTNQQGVPLWSAGAAWNLSQEDFYKLSWLPYLKLRASYGVNGNVDKNLSAYTTAFYIPSAPLTRLPFAQILNPPNPDLRWEQVRIANIGLDFETRGGRVGGSLEFYHKSGLNLIGDSPLPPSSGISTFTGNTAGTSGNGLDLTLNTQNLDRGLKWNTTLLLSYLREKVTSYKALQPLPNQVQFLGVPVPGRPLYALYSYKWAGLDPQTGDPQGYLNGQLSQDYNALVNTASAADIAYSGPARPPLFGSLRNTFSWQQFTFSANISYRLGYYFRKASVRYSSILSGQGGSGDYEKRWQQPGDERFTSVPAQPAAPDPDEDNFYSYSQALVGNAGNIRLQDLSLSYELSRRKLAGLPLRHLRFYLYANNVALLWEANHFGLDPDYQTGPPPRTLALGLKADF